MSGGARAEELGGGSDSLAVPGTSLRSRSVDIVLPTAEQSRYKALALTSAQAPPPLKDKVPEEAVPPTQEIRSVIIYGGCCVNKIFYCFIFFFFLSYKYFKCFIFI